MQSVTVNRFIFILANMTITHSNSIVNGLNPGVSVVRIA